MNLINDLLIYFPQNIHTLLEQTFWQYQYLQNDLQEIRIRVNQPILLKTMQADIVIDYHIKQQDILYIIEKVCENSIYAYKNQICEGFITIKGGHRIGITGTTVIEEGKVINIKYIASLNFRVAREVINCSNSILKEIINEEENNIYTSLLVSPPGQGKTTMLRDLIRQLSNGIENLKFRGRTCGVVDERGEIAAMYRGIPQNDVGLRTDIIDNVPKSKGMMMLIRSMAPEIIACDEIGSKQDVIAISEAITSGVKGIFTMHGSTMKDIKNNQNIYELIENKQIEKVIFLPIQKNKKKT